MQAVAFRKNTKSPAKIIRCAACGLYLQAATDDLMTICVTRKKQHALKFYDEDATENAQKIMRTLYPSFDWTFSSAEG